VGIVFRSRQEFDQFKPLYQGKPAELAGYFQPGDDVNYIAIPLEPGEPLYSVFHEYVHLFVKDNLPNAPLWLNEGLAEFYSTAAIGSGEATIGAPIASYVRLLRSSELLPLKTLFSVNNDSAHYHDRDKRGIFYAESWALVHYLMLANHGERQSQVGRYLSLTAAGVSVEAAFNMAFQADFATIEKELTDYLRRATFPTQRVAIDRNDSYGTIQTELLSEAEADYYLGDLLLHIGQPANAEKYFVNALSLDQNLILAHAALGMLRVRQNRLAEALRHLQRAAPTSQNHLVHFFYAYALSRQGMGEDGAISHYSADNLETMRSELQTTIRLAPDFAESYHLLAFINLVANERLDQSVDLIKRAIRLEPNRRDLQLVLAQIYLKQRETESAHRILEPLARQTDDQQLRADAELLLSQNARGPSRLPQFSSAAPTKVMSVSPETGQVSSGMRIDTTGPMPSADEVMGKYVEALGGQDRIRQVTSRIIRGKARVPGEFADAPFEITEKSPNKAVVMVKPEHGNGLGQGFDGTGGWMQAAPTGIHRLQGIELSELQRDCDFYAPLRLKINYSEVKVLGRVKIGYREAYLVEAKAGDGEVERFYFEKTSGLLIRWDGVRSNWRERASVETYYDDWRDVDGIKVPFRVTRSSPHFSIAFKVEEVRHDVTIDDVVFTQRGKK